MKRLFAAIGIVLTGLATYAQCVPMPPAANPIISILGRELTFSNVSINGGGNYANLTTGASFTVSFDFSVSTNITACPGCVTFFYVGVAGTSAPGSPSAAIYPNTDCLGSVYGGQAGSHVANFTVPTSPGYYYITMDATWTYWCHQYAITHNNCLNTSIALIVVGNPPPLTVMLDSVKDASSCGGSDGGIFITSTGGAGCYRYSWSEGSNSQNLTNAVEGLYTVTVSDGGCDTVLSGTISAPGFGFSLPQDIALCAGDSLMLGITTPLDSLLWQDGDSTLTYLISAPGTYWAEAFSGLCSERDTMIVSFNPLVIPYLGNDTVLCQGDLLALDVGPGYDSVLWQDGTGGNSIAVSNSGNYSVEVSLNSCFGRDTVMVDFDMPPVIDIGNDTNICEGESIMLNATIPGGSYLWQDGSVNPIFIADSTGTYSVVVTAGVCTVGDAITLGIQSKPAINILQNDTICEGEIKLLDANYSGANYYLWQDGITTTATFSASSAGIYWVDIALAACTVRDSAVLIVNQFPVINLNDNYFLCENDSLVLDVSSTGDSYQWQDGSTLPTFMVTTAGIYSVKAINGSCMSGDTVEVTQELLPQVNLGADREECTEDLLTTLDATFPGANYLWQDNSIESEFIATKAGIFSVTVSNACGSATDEVTVNAKDCSCKVMFPSAFSPNGDGKNDFFKPLVRCDILNFRLSVFDRWGEKIFESTNAKSGWDGFFNDELQDLGVYTWLAEYSVSNGTGVLKGEKKSGSVTLVK